MTDTEKLQQVLLDLAEIKGGMKTIAVMNKTNSEEIKRVEGRQWGLLLMIVGAFGTSLLSLLISGSLKANKLGAAFQSFYAFIF